MFHVSSFTIYYVNALVIKASLLYILKQMHHVSICFRFSSLCLWKKEVLNYRIYSQSTQQCTLKTHSLWVTLTSISGLHKSITSTLLILLKTLKPTFWEKILQPILIWILKLGKVQWFFVGRSWASIWHLKRSWNVFK